LNYLTIGRFTLPTDLLAAFAAIFIGALVYRLKEKKSIADWYWNSFFIYIAISKLSYALFNFKMFIDTPLSLLYFNGGFKGQILAFIGIALYLVVIARKKWDINEFLPVYLIFFLLYETALFALAGDVLAALIQAGVLIAFLAFYFKEWMLTGQHTILLLLVQALLFSLFSQLLSAENLSILALGIVLLFFQGLNKEETTIE
jgi:hypothetical protein